MTNPSRATSYGRDAPAGSSLRSDSVRDAADESGAYDLATNLGYEAIHRSLAYAIEV